MNARAHIATTDKQTVEMMTDLVLALSKTFTISHVKLSQPSNESLNTDETDASNVINYFPTAIIGNGKCRTKSHNA